MPRQARPTRWLTVLAATALTTAGTALAAPAASAADSTQCTFPSKAKIKGLPWSLQRVQLDQLWSVTKGAGERIAVIDTGVDNTNKQLRGAVDTTRGANVLPKKLKKDQYGEVSPRGKANGTTDTVGHGTKVAGIIAARPSEENQFVGIAPEATIIPIKQNDDKGSGTAQDLARAIQHAVKVGADVINISQDTEEALPDDNVLHDAVNEALRRDIVVVASAGNDGLGGNVKETYPAAYDGVLAVAASDRNNERAVFSQSGDFVGVAAPGVDMVSTVPKGGLCVDNGTSFSAPYVAGVAALVRAAHKDWGRQRVVTQIEQTAERSIPGRDDHVGWGVVDPVRAVTEEGGPVDHPVAQGGVSKGAVPDVPPLPEGETPQQRDERLGTYAVVGGGLLVAVIAGSSLVYRDWRRRRPVG
ncbi:type VII secretion-associated serine protease mycosin [Streptomyces sp. Ru73]|uniref:type VII secretion-associated serine protease mycosin n=1 Tax=Streptomyces sp. Ru73 TaxID=2080748 RepID=UPI000CDD7F25|nr:type VII secretion-associated serine protease mycosin [Streptomyces sp. Ru73]POX37378.1 type VII secretion-associated serine protease mycosin [Streptomyces sp. Ru73]